MIDLSIPLTTHFFRSLLVLDNEHSVGALDAFYYGGQPLNEILDYENSTLLEKRFAAFHRVLEHDLHIILKSSTLSAMVFSDSAFVVFEDQDVALVFSQAVMRHMMAALVPVRIGVASGTFSGLRFMTDMSSAISLHSSHFLGSSIVRAHKAESSGHPGMRILLDPSLPLVRDDVKMKCSINYCLVKKHKPEVVDELNYLVPVSDDIRPPFIPGPPIHAEPVTDERLVKAVLEMKELAPSKERHHYDFTLTSMKAMARIYGIQVAGLTS